MGEKVAAPNGLEKKKLRFSKKLQTKNKVLPITPVRTGVSPGIRLI